MAACTLPAPAQQAQPAPAQQAQPAPAQQSQPAPAQQAQPVSAQQAQPWLLHLSSVMLLPCNAPRAGKRHVAEPIQDAGLLRVLSCEIQYGPLNCDFDWGPNRGVVSDTQLAGFAACGVAVPSPDMVTPQRMGAFVWSWAMGQPAGDGQGGWDGGGAGKRGGGAGCGSGEPCWAVVNGSDGRWYAAAGWGEGAGALPRACRRQQVGGADGRFGAGGRNRFGAALWVLGAGGCGDGYEFDVPHAPWENQLLLQLLRQEGAAGVQLALQPPDYLPAWLGLGHDDGERPQSSK
jgi:hypothetical protein